MGETIKEIVEQRKYELIGIFLMVLALLNAVTLIFGDTGIVGELLSTGIIYLTGVGTYIFTGLLFAFGVVMIYKSRFKLVMNSRFIGLLLIVLVMLILFHMTADIAHPDEFEIVGQKAGGGVIGAFILYVLRIAFGQVGTYVILATIFLFGLLLISDILLANLFLHLKTGKDGVKDFCKNLFKSKRKKASRQQKVNKAKKINKKSSFSISDILTVFKKKKNEEKLSKDEPINQVKKSSQTDLETQAKRVNTSQSQKDKKPQKAIKQNSTTTEVKRSYQPSNEIQQQLKLAGYQLPTLDLLDVVEQKRDLFVDQTDILKQTLDSFGVRAEVVDVNYGPTVTRYEVQPAPGVKVSKILSLADDIALAMAASDVRIEAPIPGKAAVGIEMPNQNQALVTIRELFESDAFQNSASKLTMALGKDIGGQAIVADLAKMPHMLVAGATGSGKSVFINTVINSILYKAKPTEVKFLLIDPKMVELISYKNLPHLVAPVVTDAKKASTALRWAVQQMEKRYQLFADNAARGIDSYNQKVAEPENKLPYLVIIIDELADLMMVSASEVEDAICRLAQKARAAGIHLILATQRPSVDVITGVIKANIPTRVSFALSSQADSRTILDGGGAEKLLGKGDMLFAPVDSNQPQRVQGAFISEAELKRIVNFVKEQKEPEYDDKIANIKDQNVEIELDDEKDELYEQAVKLVVEHRASISMLQRKLRIGYNRAARMIDSMAEDNIVGPHQGSKAREVLIEEEELKEILGTD